MNGPIVRITRERIQERSETIIHASWLHHPSDSLEPVRYSFSNETWIRGPELVLGQCPASPVLVILGPDAQANTKILRYATTATRIYAIVDSNTNLDGLQSPKVLARRVAEVPASAFQSAGDSRVWVGGGLSVKLDDRQGDALRHMFLRLFWYDGIEEAWLDGRQLLWRPSRDRPFDVPELPVDAPIRLVPPKTLLSHDLRNAIVHITCGDPPTVAPRQLWFPPGAAHHKQLAKLVRDGTEVHWSQLSLPDLCIGASSGEALLAGSRHKLRILLTAEQAFEAEVLLDRKPAWRFRTDVCIGDLAVREMEFWLPDTNGPHSLEEMQDIGIPKVQADSIRGMPDAKPSTWPAPQPLALSARYLWTVLPARLPAGSEEDQIVKRWRTIDDTWKKRTTMVIDALESLEHERTRLDARFPAMKRSLLGFAQQHKVLSIEALSLVAACPSKLGPAIAETDFCRLAELEKAVEGQQNAIRDAEKKACEDEEREKQRSEWAIRINTAKERAARVEKELTAAKEREHELNEEKPVMDELLRMAKSKEAEDIEVMKMRNRDERQKTVKLVKKLTNELTKHDQDARIPFSFTPSKPTPKAQGGTGKRFVPTASGGPSAEAATSLSFPVSLPEIGSLRTHKGKRYLVIDKWEHLDAGEREASRLSAALVAPEKA
ncbi:MAG: hypothetical protein FWD57_04180 [Polyangiaceae bacterium]|nr:hypothetical protein [Polyangiaceae bacterium]